MAHSGRLGIRRRILHAALVSLLLVPSLACGKGRAALATPSPFSSSTPFPALKPTPFSPTATTVPPSAATDVPPPTIVPATAVVSGLAVTDVQFALDVDRTGALIFPAKEFVYGVTRVYVRFSYRELGVVTAAESIWYRNENPVSVGELAWDGGENGVYVVWVEDVEGLGRGEWRWELVAVRDAHDGVGRTPLGGGTFTVGGEPGYTNEVWGLSFDPPPAWEITSEGVDSVTFSSPDQRTALALRFGAETTATTEITAADLALFQADLPEAQVVATEEVTMGGERAFYQELRFIGQQDGQPGLSGEQSLFIVSAFHTGSTYSLWVLGDAKVVGTLKKLLVTTLHSIRFSSGE